MVASITNLVGSIEWTQDHFLRSAIDATIQESVPAGYPLEVFENSESVDVPSSFVHPDNYVLRVNGPSMQDDGILDGDLVIIQKVETAKNGDTVVAYVNDEATLKKYHRIKQRVELHPKNTEFDIIKINESDDFRIGGIVLGVIRKY